MTDKHTSTEVQLDEASAAARFNEKVKQAKAAHEAGRHKNAKMHMDHAQAFMLGVKSTDMGKIKDAYSTYKELRKIHEEVLDEELTDKTIRPTDKIKVARVIADMLGVEKAESMTPEAAINMGLRKIKNKRMTPELISVLTKMLKLAQDVGVKVDTSLVPKDVKESMDVVTPFGRNDDNETDILRLKDYIELQRYSKANQRTKVGHSMHVDQDDDKDHLRKMKVRYKTEDMDSADYKINPMTGRKYRAHRINFANSGAKGKLQHDDVMEQSVDVDTGASQEKASDARKKAELILRHTKEKESLATRHHNQKRTLTKEESSEVLDLSDDDINALADTVEFDHLIDALDDDNEISFVDSDTGEEIEDDSVNEEHLMEVLSRAERMRAKIRFVRTKSKRERRVQIALKRRADPKTLNKRARRIAISLLKQKLMKKPVSQMSVAEKERVERMIQQRRSTINRLALRLTPKVRRLEADRLSGQKSTSPSVGV